MATSTKQSQRFTISIALFATSVITAFAISYLSQRSTQYWVLARPIAQGAVIQEDDLSRGKALLRFGSHGYVESSVGVSGAIATRDLSPGEILNRSAISMDRSRLSIAFLSFSIRASDFPSGTSIGQRVEVYQVNDTRNGEQPIAPTLILRSASVTAISQKGANFGSDLAISLAVQSQDVERLLGASASGRLVVVRVNG